MRQCFQFKTMDMLQHGESVREWYEDLKKAALGERHAGQSERIWRLPSWIDHEAVRHHFQTADDNIIALYQIYHDCGKPMVRAVDTEGRQHFPDHAAASKARWLECSDGSEAALEIAELIGMDMDIHLLKADGVDEFASRPQAMTLLLTGLCELHSNAQMFGGIDSSSFKQKWKNIERFGKKICAARLRHYVVVRRDLPPGAQLAQTIHAAGESASPRPEPGCRAVALHAADEQHLKIVKQRLDKSGLSHYCVYESEDSDYPNQLMAIGLAPTADREGVRKVLGSLPLAK